MPDTMQATATHATTLRMLPRCGQLAFRGDAAALARAGDAFGVALSATPCRAHEASQRASLWLGPDEWLLLTPSADTEAAQAALAGALENLPYALIDVSSRDVAFELEGPDATAMLNAGCPLDLDEEAFPLGMCTRTVLAKAPIILWRKAADRFNIHVWRSFGPYVHDFLIEARTRL